MRGKPKVQRGKFTADDIRSVAAKLGRASCMSGHQRTAGQVSMKVFECSEIATSQFGAMLRSAAGVILSSGELAALVHCMTLTDDGGGDDGRGGPATTAPSQRRAARRKVQGVRFPEHLNGNTFLGIWYRLGREEESARAEFATGVVASEWR